MALPLMYLRERLSDPGWLMTALLLIAMVAFLVFLRIREARRIVRKFSRERIVLTSFSVTFYGLESEPGGPARSVGALVLSKDGLYFLARVSHRELTIPGSAIIHLDVTNTHRGRTLRQYVLAIRFLNSEGKGETAAFRLLRPARWITAIKATLIGDRTP
jgi:hypothetical protein